MFDPETGIEPPTSVEMSDKISDYDKRQIELMKNQIIYFKEKNMDLGSLISRLESLFSVLENKNIPWKNAFWKEWDNLEIIFATMLDEENEDDNLIDGELIKNSVNNLYKILCECE